MVLKKLHMGTMSFGLESMDELRRNLDAHLAYIYDAGPEHSLLSKGHRQRPSLGGGGNGNTSTHPHAGKSRHRDLASRIGETVQALALCHNVTPAPDEVGDGVSPAIAIGIDAPVTKMSYQASSPDEVAIVKWTESVGLALVYRDMSSMRLHFTPGTGGGHGGTTLEFDILHVFPFTSETKRMGIIVRNVQTTEVMLYMKGWSVKTFIIAACANFSWCHFIEALTW